MKELSLNSIKLINYFYSNENAYNTVPRTNNEKYLMLISTFVVSVNI